MEHGQLLSHVDTDLVARPQLRVLPIPAQTSTFKPIPHIELVDMLDAVLAQNQIRIEDGIHRSGEGHADDDAHGGDPGARQRYPRSTVSGRYEQIPSKRLCCSLEDHAMVKHAALHQKWSLTGPPSAPRLRGVLIGHRQNSVAPLFQSGPVAVLTHERIREVEIHKAICPSAMTV